MEMLKLKTINWKVLEMLDNIEECKENPQITWKKIDILTAKKYPQYYRPQYTDRRITI